MKPVVQRLSTHTEYLAQLSNAIVFDCSTKCSAPVAAPDDGGFDDRGVAAIVEFQETLLVRIALTPPIDNSASLVDFS